jgi:hypothetical protein
VARASAKNRKSLTAKIAKGAKERKSFTAKDAKAAEENKSLTAKEIIIRTKAKSEGREGTAPRVAYNKRFWSYYRRAQEFFLESRIPTAPPIPHLALS